MERTYRWRGTYTQREYTHGGTYTWKRHTRGDLQTEENTHGGDIYIVCTDCAEILDYLFGDLSTRQKLVNKKVAHLIDKI